MGHDFTIWGASWPPKLTATLIYPWAKTPIGVQNETESVKRACGSVLERDSLEARETYTFLALLQMAGLSSRAGGSSIFT